MEKRAVSVVEEPLAIVLALSLLWPAVSNAQAPTSRMHALAEFEGTYEYRDGATLFMISSGKELVAILNEAKYPLRETGPDAFANPSEDPIPFLRDSSGSVI